MRVVPSASMQSVVGGLSRLPAWCQVVCLDLNRGGNTGGAPIGAEGARSLAEGLGKCPECSSLATLDLEHNNLGAEGARRMAVVLVDHWCSAIELFTH